MPLGTWQIFNAAIAVPAWETLNKADPDHHLVISSGNFALRDAGLTDNVDDRTDVFPVVGAFDVLFAFEDVVGYTQGTTPFELGDPSDPAKQGMNISSNTASGYGGFIISGVLTANAINRRGGYMIGTYLMPGMRIRCHNKAGAGSATLIVWFQRRGAARG